MGYARVIVVYTAITDEYDKLRTPEAIEPGVRYVAFSDRPQSVAGWDCQPFPQCFGRDARHNSRIPKMLPHLLLDCEYSIYHDGPFVLKERPSRLIHHWLGLYDVAMMTHPCHNTYLQEAGWDGVSDAVTPGQIQAKSIADRGLAIPGCWAAGFIVRRHTPKVAAMGEAWMREYLAGTTNDQISLIPAIAASGVTVNTIDQQPLNTPVAGYCLHADTNCQDNAGFAAERDAWRARVARIWEVCSK